MSVLLKRKKYDSSIEYITLQDDQMDKIRDLNKRSKVLKEELNTLCKKESTGDEKREDTKILDFTLVSDKSELAAVGLLGAHMINPNYFFLVQEHKGIQDIDFLAKIKEEFKQEERNLECLIQGLKDKAENVKRQKEGSACRVWHFSPKEVEDEENKKEEEAEIMTLEKFLSLNTLDTAKSGTLDIQHNFRKGDLLSNDDYRGTGLYYFDGKLVYKTTGEYGYFIPSVDFEMVKQHDLEFFNTETGAGAEFILIPKECRVTSDCADDNCEDEENDGNFAMSLAHVHQNEGDRVVVDGVEYLATFCRLY